jgi:hypothetical protein
MIDSAKGWRGPGAGRNRNAGRLFHSTHGLSRTPAYSSWVAMMHRCHDPASSAFPSYGGRGVAVCQEWHDFANFYGDMGDRPPGHTLDRIDNGRGYEPGNCRWADKYTQSINRCTTIWLSAAGVSRPLVEWAARIGADPQVIYQRLRRGWPEEKSATTPLRPKRRATR